MSYVNQANINNTDCDLHDRRLGEFTSSDAGKIPTINSTGTGFEYGSGSSGMTIVECDFGVDSSTGLPTGVITPTTSNFYSTINDAVLANQPVMLILNEQVTVSGVNLYVGKMFTIISNVQYNTQSSPVNVNYAESSLTMSFDGSTLTLVTVRVYINNSEYSQSVVMSTVPSMGS